MKQLLVAILMISTTGLCMAANMDKGTYELRTGGMVDFQSANGSRVDANFGMGQFIADLVEVGVLAGFSDDDSSTSWSLGGYAEYNFATQSLLFPYVGGVLSLSGADLTAGSLSENNTGLVLDMRAGVKYFLTEDLALDGLLSWRLASDDLYLDDTSPENTDWRLLFGLRYFFDI